MLHNAIYTTATSYTIATIALCMEHGMALETFKSRAVEVFK